MFVTGAQQLLSGGPHTPVFMIMWGHCYITTQLSTVM